MVEFNLKPDEFVVTKSESVRYAGDNPNSRGTVGSYKNDLILTNQRIVLVTKSMFGKAKTARDFPLEKIRIVEGRPQATASGEGLEVYLTDRLECFRFLRKHEARNWAHNISILLNGSSEPFRSAQDRVAYVADTMKDTFDTFKHSFRPRSRNSADVVAQACLSCGASMSGVAGRVVRCRFCETDQKLQPED